MKSEEETKKRGVRRRQKKSDLCRDTMGFDRIFPASTLAIKIITLSITITAIIITGNNNNSNNNNKNDNYNNSNK